MEKTIRILTSCYEYPPLGGGGSRVAQGLSQELVRQGHDVSVVTMGYDDLPKQEEVEGVDVHRIRCGRRRQYQCTLTEAVAYVMPAVAAARRLSRRAPFDIVHAHFIFPDGVGGRWLKRRTGAPLVISAHGSDVPSYNPHRLKVMHRLLAPLWKSVVRTADRVVCPSEYLRSLMLQQVPDVAIEKIPYGIDVGETDLGQPRKRRILAAARIVKLKGMQHLVEAVAKTNLDHEVHIVGDGPYLPELRRQAAEQGAPVKFWGWLDNQSPEMQELLATSNIFVLASEAENFPVSLMEAMRSGMAIVTSRGTGCAETVGEAALLVDPGDVDGLRSALMRLDADPALCRSLGAAARQRLEDHFSWPAIAKKYLNLYECLLSESSTETAGTATVVPDEHVRPQQLANQKESGIDSTVDA